MTLATLLTLSAAHAATLTVNSDGTGDHTSVQAAVDAASSGDTINIGPGTFNGAISVSAKTLYIQGSGIGATVLDGDGAATVLTIQGAGLNLTQLTVQGGTQGVNLSSVVGSLDTVEIRSNSGAATGGGIAIRSDSNVNLLTVYIEGNAATDGGGLHLDASSRAAITDGWIVDNASSGLGGGIYAEGNLTLTTTTIRENEAGVHGGGAFVTGISPDITETDFWGNVAGSNGGGIAIVSTAVDSVSPRLKQSEFWLNEAAGDGGGVYIDAAGQFYIREILAVLNTAENDGGALWASGGRPSITFMRAWYNQAGNDGGGAYLTANNGGYTRKSSFGGNSATNRGGGAAHTAANNNHFVYNNRYIENAAETGAGLLIDGDPSRKMQVFNVDSVGNAGSGITVLNSASSKVINSVVAYNEGDGLVVDAASKDNINLRYNNVFGNAAGYGGAMTDADAPDLDINVEPLLTRFDADGDPISDFLYPATGSPCLNAGNPVILNRDGSRSHIGSYGGPDAEGGDEDGDGVGPRGGDCDDGDPASTPGNEEVQGDGRDNDCEGGGELDLDGDGVLYPIDCDDENADVYPGAEDATGDGIDADCDGLDGDDPGPEDTGDGPPEGADTGAPWVDEDTGGDPYEDADRDGYAGDDDCNDADPNANPGADEVCDDGIDNDCDGSVDAKDSDCRAGDDSGCGCAASQATPGAAAWVLGLMALVARRRSARA
ncbi:MAG: MopE-related protein [Myxococcota bacterium]|nr:MopE-related protein [Myxococcota bacterium]